MPVMTLHRAWALRFLFGRVAIAQMPSTLSDARTLSGADEEAIGFGPDPSHEGVEVWVSEQGLHGGVLASQLSFRQHRVDLAMADAVQAGRDAPTLAFGDQMVSISLGGRNRTTAQWADHDDLCRLVRHVLCSDSGIGRA